MGWETADQVEKGILGSGNRKSRFLGGQTAEERGLKVQSPILASGGVPGLQKKKGRHVGKNNLIPDFLGFYKRGS